MSEADQLKDKIVDLEDRIMDIEDRLERIELDGREQEMHDQFNQQSNHGY